ncbi:MAG: hypothetical protein Q8R37_03595 [Nanoarchaeota archaeon]|nr:hypothetical protein [Nanoarchaeota archaeon]
MEREEQLKQIRQVLEECNRHDIHYCILRNYEFLLGDPMAIESMDTVVSTEDFPRLDAILRQYGFIQRQQQFSLKHKAYFKLVNLQKISFDLQVGGVHWNDMKYLDVIQNRFKKDFLYVPSDNDTFVMLLVHSILGKRYCKLKYQRILRSLVVDKEYVLSQLSRIFNTRIARQLYQLVTEDKFEMITPYRLAAYFVIKKPSRILTLSALSLRWLRWKKLFRPYPLISIVGPDGAGKSTVVSGLKSYFQNQGRKVTTIYMGRGRSHLLPVTKLGMKYKSREKQKKASPQKLWYILSAPVFALDLWLRYYIHIFPIRMKKTMVITDRYCSDIILMKNVPFWIKRALLSLFPKPTISILLYNSPDVLHQRRPEEPIAELERQLAIFNRFDYSLTLKTMDKEHDFETVAAVVVEKLLREWY